jgi:hypothetical protein
MRVAIDENFVFVTNNGKDFLELYAKQELHPGLIIVLPGGLKKDEQRRLFEKVLDAIEPLQDIVNKVVSVDLNGVIDVYDYPPGCTIPDLSSPAT